MLKSKTLVYIVLLTALITSTVVVQPVRAQDSVQCLGNISTALKWTLLLQNDDGGFTNGFQPTSDLSATADLLFAVNSAQWPLDTLTNSQGKTPLDYLLQQLASDTALSTGQFGKLLLALAGGDSDVTNFSDQDLVALTNQAAEKLIDGSDLFSLGLVVLGLQAVDAPVSDALVTTLKSSRNEDGGWPNRKGDPSNTNASAVVVQALLAVEPTYDVSTTLAYFKAMQNTDQGWPYQNPSDYGTDTDSNSTAAVIQALIAAKQDLTAWGNPHQTLVKFQQPSGSFTFQLAQPADSFLSTVAAIPALCGVSLVKLAVPIATATPEAMVEHSESL